VDGTTRMVGKDRDKNVAYAGRLLKIHVIRRR